MNLKLFSSTFIFGILTIAGGMSDIESNLSPFIPSCAYFYAVNRVGTFGWQMGMLKSGTLYLADAQLKIEKKLAGKVDSFIWSQDGKKIALMRGKQLFILDAKSGKEQRVALEKTGFDKALSLRPLTFDPIRDAVVCTDEKDLHVILIKPDQVERSFSILAGQGHGESVASTQTENTAAWSPSGKFLAFTRDGDVWLADRGDMKSTDPWWLIESNYYGYAERIAPLAYYEDRQTGASNETAWVTELSWFPDEHHILVHRTRVGGSGRSDIGIVELNPAGVEDINHPFNFEVSTRWLSAHGYSPTVCPDGKTISILMSNPESSLRWTLFNPEDSSERTLATEDLHFCGGRREATASR